MTELQVAGVVVIVALVGFNAAFFALWRRFDYPETLTIPKVAPIKPREIKVKTV